MNAGVWLRRVAFTLLVLVVALGVLTARVVRDGEAALARSDAAFNRGDLREAILHARRAAVLYAPGAPHVAAAFARLRAVAVGAEAASDPEVARQAWGAVRGAALETRHVTTPHRAELAQADAALARLQARGAVGAPEVRAAALAQLARDDSPRAVWVAVLGAGFAVFCAGIVVAAARGASPSGRLALRPLSIAVGLCVVGLALWTLAVYRA